MTVELPGPEGVSAVVVSGVAVAAADVRNPLASSPSLPLASIPLAPSPSSFLLVVVAGAL